MRKLTAANFIAAIAILFIVTSCSKGGGGGGGSVNTTLTLSMNKSSVRADNFEEVVITVRDQSGADVTSSCMFNINNTTWSTNTYHTKSIGAIPIYATKSGAQSNTVTLTGIDPGPSPFTQKTYVEDFTGSWCGYCPRVGISLASYATSHPNAIVVSVHGPAGSGDPYIYTFDTQLRNAFSVSSWPFALINRDYKWNENPGVIDNELAKRAPLGLSLVSTVSGSTINVTAKVKFDVTTTVGMKLVLMLVQDGLVYPQTNYYAPQYGGDPITNYTHNHVLRAAATDIFGDVIPAAQQTIGNTWQNNYQFNAAAYNIANCKIVGVVIFDNNGNNYKGALNVQEVAAGQTKNFD
jgi:hypothetical protein